MNPSADLNRLALLVDALLDVSPEDRAARIDQLADGDPVRRADLQRMAVELEREPAILTHGAVEQFAGLLHDVSNDFPRSLAERYEVRQVLGYGGMATVYLASDRKHMRDVAVKVVDALVATASGADRFLREIEIVAQLRYPLIVPLYDSGQADGQLYYVMPYEAGLSLDRKLETEGALPIEDAVAILRDVADALAHAHARGIVHRDIKPANVLLAGRHALVSDFGIAKAVEDESARAAATASGMVIGTPTYMAPEQCTGDTVDARSDIYAVGVMAYELLTGQPPFARATRQEILAAHRFAAPPAITSHRSDVPAPLANLIMTCLAKRPDDRVQTAGELVQRLDALVTAPIVAQRAVRRRGWILAAGVAAAVIVVVVLARWQWRPSAAYRLQRRWAEARIERLTDFRGDEVDASISSDGRFVAFLADRDSVFDAYVTQVGSDQFTNLTGGRLAQLFNEDVRNIGFTSDASEVWIRSGDITAPGTVSVIPTLGGRSRVLLNGAVMTAWSPDGSQLAYHLTVSGDPIFVADADGANARQIFVANAGEHAHYVAWSADSRFIYFVRGTPPNEMDIWRVPSSGGTAERLTTQQSRVAYPVALDDATLLYTAIDEYGKGPWLYAMDLNSRGSVRIGGGVEHYLSIAAAADSRGQSRRLVATVSNPATQLFEAPIGDSATDESGVTRLNLPLERAAAPRFASDSSLWYLASRSGGDRVWRVRNGDAAEVWKASDGAIASAVAILPHGDRACAAVRSSGRATLYCWQDDRAGVVRLAENLDVRGDASWSPDGQWLAVAAVDSTGVRIFKVPAGGGAPVRLTNSASFNPVWSPDGTYIAYSTAPRARSARVAAVTPDGAPHPFPSLTVDRLGDNYRFMPDGKQLVVKLGGFRRQDFWLVDLASGARRQLTRLRPGAALGRFDVAPDGKRFVFDRMRENSDIALIELPSR